MLGRCITEESKEAALVIINLPVPGEEAEADPQTYVDMVDRLTANLGHCVLLSGLSDGTQAISVYQQ